MVVVTRYFLGLKRVPLPKGWQLLELYRCHCTNHFLILFVNPPEADVNDIQGATFGKTLVYHSESTTIFTLKNGSKICRLILQNGSAFLPLLFFFFLPRGDAMDWNLGEQLILGEYFEYKKLWPPFHWDCDQNCERKLYSLEHLRMMWPAPAWPLLFGFKIHSAPQRVGCPQRGDRH